MKNKELNRTVDGRPKFTEEEKRDHRRKRNRRKRYRNGAMTLRTLLGKKPKAA